MEPAAAELQKQLSQFLSRLDEQKELLETQAAKWRNYQDDYSALEKQLQTLPDQTSRSAMIPIGQLAFMPGKIIHTNEILVLLGDQYYAERSAKQAIDIVKRRKQVVSENLNLVEGQLNALKSKSDIAFTTDVGVNEEGLPIMEIREELPKEDTTACKPVISAQVSEKAPATKKPVDAKEYKEVMDLLEKMELEEEELERSGKLEQSTEDNEENREEEDEDEEDEDLYDREISDTIFDHFDDDEEYAMQGIVEEEDATIHFTDISDAGFRSDVAEEESPVIMNVKEHVTTDVRSNEPTLSNERKKISKFKAARFTEKTANISASEDSTSSQGKISKFKAALQQEKLQDQSELVKPAQAPKKISKFKAALEQQKREDENVSEQSKPAPTTKKVSKFKAARQKEKASETGESTKIEGEKRSVTWDSVATVREHDTLAAPAEPVSVSYNEPVKKEHVPGERTLQKTINSPADIFSIVKEQAQIPLSLEDDYPALDMDSGNPSEPINFMELAEKAKAIPQKIYTTLEEPRAVKPLIQEVATKSTSPQSKTSNMDTPTMKGVVMERETEPMDLEQVEEDMDFREISTRYHQKRLDYYAAMNGFANNEESWEKEVIDEELPLPGKENEETKDDNPRPRRISKFKAARLGMNIQEMRHS